MTINISLLVAAPMLQDYIVDKDTGTPLADGIVTCYIDTSRTFLKNWYYQTGQPGAYSYIPLDNPLRLSSVGTIQDPNGNDVIPFFYPFVEDNDNNTRQAYYITVDSTDADGQVSIRQFTRENFPFAASSGTVSGTPTLKNVISNNRFWRNIGLGVGTPTSNLTNFTNIIIAPSQHDGYTNDAVSYPPATTGTGYSDIRFIKNIVGATDTLSFPTFDSSVIFNNAIKPEFYLNLACTGLQVGETQKWIQIPIALHVANLANVAATVTIWARAATNGQTLGLYKYQFLGVGAPSQPAPVLIQNLTLSTEWQLYAIPFTFQDNSGVTLGVGGDDAFFLVLSYPVAQTFNIGVAIPGIYLSATYPTNDFDTYDQINAIISSPRTGHVQPSYSGMWPYGYVLMNDGTIGNAGSGATTRESSDVWPLYSLLWNNVDNAWAPVSTGRGVSAYADFAANKTMGLLKMLGRTIASIGTPSSGSGSTNFVLGEYGGNQTITLATNQLPTTLTSTADYLDITFAPGANRFIVSGGAKNPGGTIENAGGAQPINVLNPTQHTHFYIKL